MPDPDTTKPANVSPLIVGQGLGAWWLELHALLHLGMPLAATQLAQMAILATDTLMLGHLSKDALAAAALGNAVYFAAWMLGCGPANAIAPVIAHVLGEGKPRDIGPAARMGLWASLIIIPPLLAVLLATRPIMLALGEAPGLADGAGLFMSSLCWGLPFAIGFQALRNYATALSRPLAPMLVVGITILFNALGDWCLIFGHFGFPALGLFGSGLASALSNVFSFVLMLAIIHLAPDLRTHHILKDFWTPHWKHLKEIFRLGLPIGLTTIFEILLFNTATVLMGLFGATALAAHQVAITIPALTFMVPLGVGMAATVRVGQAAGAGDMIAARRAGFTALGVAAIFMTASSTLILTFPHLIAGAWFSADPANDSTIALTVVFLHVAAAFQVADGLQVSAAMALRGLKDAHAPMWIAGASYWLAGFPMCMALGFGLHMQGLGIWIGLAFGLFVAATLLVLRFIRLSEKMHGRIQQT